MYFYTYLVKDTQIYVDFRLHQWTYSMYVFYVAFLKFTIKIYYTHKFHACAFQAYMYIFVQWPKASFKWTFYSVEWSFPKD